MNKKISIIFIKTFFIVIILLLNLYSNSYAEDILEEKNVNNIIMEYIYNKDKNKVTAIMKSNVELVDIKSSWILSNDKLTYTKEFSLNQKYTTPVQDILGNITQVEIEITQIDDKGPQIIMDYEYNEETNEVLAIMKSDEEIENTKPSWILSDDKLNYSKKFGVNQKYTTPVQDKWGNISNVKIEITDVDDKGPQIIMSYKYNKETNEVLGDRKSVV